MNGHPVPTVLSPPRGQRTECHGCGRRIAKAHRVFRGIACCSTCYAREFKPRPCRNCGVSVRLHRSQETGLCRTCERAERRCMRCERPVPRAALLIEGRVVCPSCRRYFPPFLEDRRPVDHETCSVCRKHRRVARRDDQGRPLCSRCAERDRREEVRAQDESYWREGVLNRHLALEPSLSTAWARDLLSGFIEYQLGRTPSKRLALALADHVQRIQILERRFGSLGEINAEQLLARYTPDEMRRSQSLLAYLHSAGVETPSRDQREDLAEERRIAALLEKVRFSPHAPLVRRFQAALGQPNTRGHVPQKRSRRSSFCAACGWVTLVGDDVLSQKSLEQYLRQTPGQRAALSAFIGFLRRAEGMDLSLPAKPTRKARRASQQDGDEALARCLSVLGDEGSDFADRRAALAGVLMGLLGLSLRTVVRYSRQGVVGANDDQLKLTMLGPDIDEVTLDPRVATIVERYLSVRDQLVGLSDGFLLPGRPIHQHVSESTVATRLQVLGAPVRVLSMSGATWIKGRTGQGLSR